MAHVDEDGNVRLAVDDWIGSGLATLSGCWFWYQAITFDSVGLFLVGLIVQCSDLVIIKLIVGLEKRERGASR